METRMNSIQKNYLAAKAARKVTYEIQAKKFQDFLAAKGLTEDDVDGKNFNALNAEYEVFAKEEIEATALAWEIYKQTEKALIDFGIAIAPANIREKLAENVKKFYTIKDELIETVVKLDVNTLPKAMRT
jgi:hypothetical protein